MCRHVAWLGAPRSIAGLVLDPPHGLLRQSYAPRRQRRGVVNADGWGVGFFDATATVRRWRSSRPIWSDASFASIAPMLCAGAVLAAVRDATAGMPADETAAAPFTDGRWLLSHNGAVALTALPATHAAESTSDSAVLAAHVLAALAGDATAASGPGAVLADTVRGVARADPGASLGLLLTDGARILATTWGDPLSYLVTADGVAVASEPWDDDPAWVDVSDRQLVEATLDGVTVTAMEF